MNKILQKRLLFNFPLGIISLGATARQHCKSNRGEFFHISNFQQLAEIFEKIRYELFDEDIQKLQIELSDTIAQNLQTTNVESERLVA